MIVGIDGRSAEVEKKAGINVYTHEIICNLESDCHVYFRKRLRNKAIAEKSFVHPYVIQFPSYRWKFDPIWERTALPYLSNKTKPDVFWGPRFYVPPRLKCPSVTTIHDIAFALIPDIVSKKQFDYFDTLIKDSIENSTHFISVSEATKQDFCKFYNVDEKKVTVIYNGFNPVYMEKVEEAYIPSVKSKFNISNDFILFLGTIEPRKNLVRLVDAYINSDARKNKIPLVLAGKKGWFDTELNKKISPLVEKNEIIMTGFLSTDELRALFQSCLFFAFPSIYEGFGIPAIEAMASGAPVLTSNNSSLIELFADSAQIIDPLSIDSITEGINKFVNDSAYRNEIKKKGEAYAKKFSWKKCAQEHLEVFKSVAAK